MILLTVSVNPPPSSTFSFHIHNLISMRFSLFTVLSGLAALAVVSALPAENLQRAMSLSRIPIAVVSLIVQVNK